MGLTRRRFVGCACCAGAAPLTASAAPGVGDGSPQLLELGTPLMTRIAPTVWVAGIAAGVWLHTTTALIDGGLYYPANGLVVDRPGGALLIDTGWNPHQADILLHWCKDSGRPITAAVATHFHRDRTGGIPALQKAGIVCSAFPLTCDLARRNGMPAPTPIPGFFHGAHAVGADLDYFFPGAGHTRDNILVWLPRQRVLFGGCFLKSSTTDDLGYVQDAVIADWPGSVERARAAYPSPLMVVPGHGTMHGDSVAATLSLLARDKR